MIVRGDQFIAGAENCPDADEGTYLMKGDLVGCWYTDTFEVRQEKDNPGGSFKASGTEHFVGCLDTNGSTTCDAGEPYGEFNLTFTYSAKFAPTGEQILGRCHHMIVGGTGDFAGASGVISFKDIPSEGRFPYHGNIKVWLMDTVPSFAVRDDPARTAAPLFVGGTRGSRPRRAEARRGTSPVLSSDLIARRPSRAGADCGLRT